MTTTGYKPYNVVKGAVAAHSGVLGVIPGRMGAKSYIVRGLGKEESLCSCNRGAAKQIWLKSCIH